MLRYWRADVAMFVAIWIVLMFAGRSRMFSDPGTFWHVVVGQIILSTGELVQADPFTFTHTGEPWIAQQWLGECLMAALHSLAGLDALLLATVTLIASVHAWLARRLIRNGMHAGLAVLVVVLCMAASAYHYHPRPQLLNLWFLGLTLAWLSEQLAEFYKPEEARLWLFTPQRLLGGATPADRIEHNRLEDVLALIAQLQDGAFV